MVGRRWSASGDQQRRPCRGSTDRPRYPLRLLELVDRPNLRVSIQTPLLVGETPEQLGRVVADVQGNNWIGATATTWGKLTYLGAGDLDFAGYVPILTRRGFDGWISVDHPNHDPWEQTAEREIRYLRRLIAGEFWGPEMPSA